jgi:hypothetical protein
MKKDEIRGLRHSSPGGCDSKASVPSLERRLAAYFLAGAGVVTVTTTANAEVIYTPADIVITNGVLPIDLNNDGTSDLHITNRESNYSTTAYRVGNLTAFGKVGAAVVVAKSCCYFGSYLPAPLRRGFPIGPDSPKRFAGFEAGLVMAAAWCYPLAANPLDCHKEGLWRKATQRFLGIRFQINGETHYGWARLSTDSRTTRLPMIKAHFTGYAYETVPDKTIAAGDQGTGSDAEHDSHLQNQSNKPNPSKRPASLGLLSLGSSALSSWR